MTLLGDRREAYRVLVSISERTRPRRTSRCRLECNVEIDLQVVGLGGMDCIAVA